MWAFFAAYSASRSQPPGRGWAPCERASRAQIDGDGGAFQALGPELLEFGPLGRDLLGGAQGDRDRGRRHSTRLQALFRVRILFVELSGERRGSWGRTLPRRDLTRREGLRFWTLRAAKEPIQCGKAEVLWSVDVWLR